MSDLLPVLYENVPQMMACAYCPKPGACCSGFFLNKGEPHVAARTFWKDSWDQDARAWLAERGLPFIPAGISREYVTAEGREYVSLVFDCENLTAAGRCGIYATRPNVCREYTPGENRLCVLTTPVNSE